MQALTYRGTVYPWQCDHVGHMNIMWYVGKFDEASWSFLAEVGLTPSYFRDATRGMGALEQHVSYRRELMAGDVVEITSRVLEVRDKVIRFAHEMKNVETGEVAAVCELTAAHLDRTTRRACPFPDAVRAAIEARLDPQS